MAEKLTHTQAVDLLCEGVHTSFRKGTDAGSLVWNAIRDMPGGSYRDAIAYLVSSLEFMGYEIAQKELKE